MPSVHSAAKTLINKKVFDGLDSFRTLEDRISALGDENSKMVGDALEIFVESYLATQPITQWEQTWLVGQVPLQIRRYLVLPADAKGIDGVYRTKHDSLVPYQVKFRSNRAYLTFTELAGFIGVTDRATERVIFTNSNELADDIIRRPGLRVVRGIDFDRLEPVDFRAIEAWLKEAPVEKPILAPRDYQSAALQDIATCLSKNDRAHVVMACGTGKTLVALWSAERLGARQILVLVPSLSLMRQTLQEWSSHNSWGADYAYICVCSDRSVSRQSDEIWIEPTEIDFRVDTDPEIVKRFLASPGERVKVVFSTYQSSPVVGQAMENANPFDVAIFDEAHKTTGPAATAFAAALSDSRVPIRKRLFFTATPRHYNVDQRDEDGDFKFVSMDDEAVYGPRAHTLTFSRAAKAGIICGYKVIISLIDKKQVDDFAFRNGLTLVDCRVSIRYKTDDDYRLGQWVAVQRATRETIDLDRRQRLEALTGWSWDGRSDRWEEGFSHLKRFSEREGHCRVSQRHDTDDGYGLGRWVTKQRATKDGMEPDRRQRLEALPGWSWEPHSDQWEEGFSHLKQFSDQERHCQVPNTYETDDDYRLGQWFAVQRAHRETMDLDRRQRIEALPVWSWDALSDKWEEGFSHMKQFSEREGHCRVPKSYRTNEGYRLGQ